MFILQLKNIKDIPLKGKKLVIIECQGCYEVISPRVEILEFKNGLKTAGYEFKEFIFDYICNSDFTRKRIEKYQNDINGMNEIVIISCGVGMQTMASILTWRNVYIACNTIYIPGLQGLTVQNYNCHSCGECRLNYTAGLCPVTLCSKGLLNGPCGGTTDDGKCEIDDSKICIWTKIFENLKSRPTLLESIPNLTIHNHKNEIITHKKT